MEKPGGNMRPKAVAILSTGEMGHAIAGVLGENGLRALTVLQGRSQRTRDLAAKSDVSDLPTMEELVAASDIVLSVVVPSAAPSVASAIAAAVNKTGKPLLYVDLNAISPMTSTAIGEVLSAAGGRYVDGCIIGASSKLKIKTTFYVSGPHASEFMVLSDFGLRVELLGDRVGQASAFKMIYAGLTKGLSALSAELLLTAYSLGIMDQIVERYRKSYPEVVAFMESNFPRLPFRAGRRSEEMEELSETIRAAGLEPFMAPASKRMLRSIGDLNLRSAYSDADEATWNIANVMEILHFRLVKENKK